MPDRLDILTPASLLTFDRKTIMRLFVTSAFGLPIISLPSYNSGSMESPRIIRTYYKYI